MSPSREGGWFMTELKNEKHRYDAWFAIGFVWDVFLSISVPTVVFALGGRWLDRRWDLSPLFTLIGLALSILSAVLLMRWHAKRFQERMREKRDAQ